MQLTGTIEAKTRTVVYDTGGFRGYTDFMIESDPALRPAPRVFLVHQQPDWVLRTHFHLEEQFQVVLGGSGSLGPHPLAPVSIHYASREAGYGPLIAGPKGLDYLTLRCAGGLGIWYLPEQREKMRANLAKRQEHVGPVAVSSPAQLALRTQTSIEVLIAPEDSGLAAWMLRLGPGAKIKSPVHENGGGSYCVIVSGTLEREKTLSTPACIFTSPEEAPLSLCAGSGGLEMLLLQFPARALEQSP